jgi:hypothetical protein
MSFEDELVGPVELAGGQIEKGLVLRMFEFSDSCAVS